MKTKNVELSHPDKELFPGISKSNMAAYYARIAPYMLPLIKNRPLTMRRFPEGIAKEGFYHKHAPDHFPDFIKRLSVPLRTKKGDVEMVMADESADLVYMAGQDVIELHMGLSKNGSLEKPDQLIFDFDPSDGDFEKVRESALAFKDLLDELKLSSFVKTTGSRGVHVHIPLKVEATFEEAKPWGKKLAEILHDRLPKITTLDHRKNKRGKKVFIDILRNDYGMTAVVPYSLRALKQASVATPIDWHELQEKQLHSCSYSIQNIFRRLGSKTDPWKSFEQSAVSKIQFANTLKAQDTSEDS